MSKKNKVSDVHKKLAAHFDGRMSLFFELFGFLFDKMETGSVEDESGVIDKCLSACSKFMLNSITSEKYRECWDALTSLGSMKPDETNEFLHKMTVDGSNEHNLYKSLTDVILIEDVNSDWNLSKVSSLSDVICMSYICIKAASSKRLDLNRHISEVMVIDRIHPWGSGEKSILDFCDINFYLFGKYQKDVSFEATNDIIKRFSAAVSIAKLKSDEVRGDGDLGVDKLKDFVSLFSRYLYFLDAVAIAKKNASLKMVSLLYAVLFIIFRQDDIICDVEFLRLIKGMFGSIYKAESDESLMLEDQYNKALALADEQWAAGDLRSHWAMAKDLIDEICEPIKKEIYEKFDKDNRIEEKKKKLNLKWSYELQKEVEELEEELKNKQNRRTMSYKELKERIVPIAKKRKRYQPKGGKRFVKKEPD